MLARRSATFRLSGYQRPHGDHPASTHQRRRVARRLRPAGRARRPVHDAERVAGRGAVHRRRTRPTSRGCPGVYPYTRGVYPSMYRGRLWTMRQFAGFGTAEETNERFRYLLAHGQAGLSTAFDMPSLMGHDSDHALSLGEVGREGVADRHARRHGDAVRRHRPRRGLRLDDDQRAGRRSCSPSTSRRRAARRSPPTACAGTIQADILKEYIAQKEWCFPVDPAMRLCGDMIEWCTQRDAALAPGVDLRLPHPRGRLDGRAGARVHAQGRPDLRRAGDRARPRRRRLRAAPVLLLQRPDRLLRGDREVPRRAPDLGARAARDASARRTRSRG